MQIRQRRPNAGVEKINPASLPLENIEETKGRVTLLCPLMVDGMGDLGIAMNIMGSLKKTMPKINLRLIVLVVNNSGHFINQLNTVKNMARNNPGVIIFQGPYSNTTGSIQFPQDGQKHRGKMFKILRRTDVLLNIPVDYRDHLARVKKVMPSDAKIIVSTEYGMKRPYSSRVGDSHAFKVVVLKKPIKFKVVENESGTTSNSR